MNPTTSRRGATFFFCFFATSCVSNETAVPTDDQIVGGTLATSYVESVVINFDGGGCSGVLVSPRVVVTASHCLDMSSEYVVTAPFARSLADRSPQVTRRAQSLDTDPSCPKCMDIGLIVLERPIVLPAYAKVASAAVPDGTRLVSLGRTLRGVMRDEMYVSSSFTSKRSDRPGKGPAYEMLGSLLENSDSGGPTMLAGGLLPHTLVGINVRTLISASGATLDMFQRVDPVVAKIQQAIDNAGGVPQTTSENICRYRDVVLRPGESAPHVDGCNTCTCRAGIRPTLACTERVCTSPAPTPANGCTILGNVVAVGQTVPFGRCNTCTCRAPNDASCTRISCR